MNDSEVSECAEADDKFIHQLAEDIINQNCLECLEFLCYIGTSCCWCEGVQDLVINELERIHKYSEDNESKVATEWEAIRNDVIQDVMGDGK